MSALLEVLFALNKPLVDIVVIPQVNLLN